MKVFVATHEGLAAGVEAALREAASAARHEPLPPLPPYHANVAASERDRFLRVVDGMMEAELLVADVSEPDHGVGWCVAWFLARGRLVVLTCRRDRRAALSPMVAGNPSPWQRVVLYDDPASLSKGLAQALAF